MEMVCSVSSYPEVVIAGVIKASLRFTASSLCNRWVFVGPKC